MRRRPLLLPLALSALAAAPRAARANMAQTHFEGERTGVLVPDSATTVHVDHETLAFTLRPGLVTAAVAAAYHLTNAGPAPASADVAFTYVRGDVHLDQDPSDKATVDLDGAALPFRAVTDADLLRPRLQTWLAENPKVMEALQAYSLKIPAAGAELRRRVEAAGGRCDDGCSGLLRWYHDATLDPDDLEAVARHVLEDNIVDAAREALPEAVEEVRRGWSTLSGAHVGFLLFHLDLAPGQGRDLTVRYEQRASLDKGAHVNPTYGFDYLLSPAKRWAGFGPLDVWVTVPARVRFASASPFRREGDTYRASFPGLPEGELRFEAMSEEGLWLGMSESGGYWAIAAAVAALAMGSVGWAAGRLCGGASRWRRVLMPLVTAGPLAAVCTLAVMVVILAAFPPAALGAGYGGAAGAAGLTLLALPVGAGVGAVSAWRRRRRAAV